MLENRFGKYSKLCLDLNIFSIPLATKDGLPASPLARSWAIALYYLIVFYCAHFLVSLIVD
jgi:hypothetical protein